MGSSRWERTRELTRGIWIAGIGLMLIRNRILPDALFLVGTVRLVEAYRHPEKRRWFRVWITLIGLGLVFTNPRSPMEALITLAVVYFIIAPLLMPAPPRKPTFDARLE